MHGSADGEAVLDEDVVVKLEDRRAGFGESDADREDGCSSGLSR
jgi:hypothetical protein